MPPRPQPEAKRIFPRLSAAWRNWPKQKELRQRRLSGAEAVQHSLQLIQSGRIQNDVTNTRTDRLEITRLGLEPGPSVGESGNLRGANRMTRNRSPRSMRGSTAES